MNLRLVIATSAPRRGSTAKVSATPWTAGLRDVHPVQSRSRCASLRWLRSSGARPHASAASRWVVSLGQDLHAHPYSLARRQPPPRPARYTLLRHCSQLPKGRSPSLGWLGIATDSCFTNPDAKGRHRRGSVCARSRSGGATPAPSGGRRARSAATPVHLQLAEAHAAAGIRCQGGDDGLDRQRP